MEQEWTPQMLQVLGLDVASLPIIWDADFLYGLRTATGDDTYVLCEINVSSCFAFPDQAPAAIAGLTARLLREARATGRMATPGVAFSPASRDSPRSR
jgi:hypothetical protein